MLLPRHRMLHSISDIQPQPYLKGNSILGKCKQTAASYSHLWAVVTRSQGHRVTGESTEFIHPTSFSEYRLLDKRMPCCVYTRGTKSSRETVNGPSVPHLFTQVLRSDLLSLIPSILQCLPHNRQSKYSGGANH